MRAGERGRRSALRGWHRCGAHRAVAARAGLPLASTTYYFSSLDDLIAKAVEYVGARETEQLQLQVAALSRRRRGAESTADLLVDLLLGEDPGPRVSERLISRYERFIACARQPELRDIQRRILRQRTDAVLEVVERSAARCAPNWSPHWSVRWTALWLPLWWMTGKAHERPRGRR